MSKGKVYIGTSGWNFDSWLGDFYPRDLKKADLLTEYARHFGSDCLGIGVSTWSVCRTSSPLSPGNTAIPSSFAIKAGYAKTSTSYWRPTTARSVFTTTSTTSRLSV